MFRIECFVTDKHLPDVLRALGQRVMNLSVVPVVHAAVEKTEGKGKPKIRQAASTTLEAWLVELRKKPAIVVQHMKDAAQAAGASPTSYGYLLKQAVAQKLIRKHGKGFNSTYEWVK
jgi:hypothetical protein